VYDTVLKGERLFFFGELLDEGAKSGPVFFVNHLMELVVKKLVDLRSGVAEQMVQAVADVVEMIGLFQTEAVITA
jgi:hypothetical protein